MAKVQMQYVVLALLGGFAALVAVDHYVLKGKLGISGRINQLIGQLKQSFGQGAGPITAAPPTDTMQTGGEGTELEASLMEAEEELAAQEPETAAMARRRAYMGRRSRRANRANMHRVRIGGFRM